MEKFTEKFDYFIGRINSKLVLKKYEEKQIVFSEGNSDENVYIIKSGKIEVNKCTLNWEERIFFILDTGYILNEEVLLSQKSSCATSCRAFMDSEIYVINKNELIKFMQNDFSVMEYIFLNSNKKLKRTYRQLKNSGTNVNLDKKILSKLWKLSLDYGIEVENGILIDLRISSTIIAKMIGAKRESVSRKLNSLKKSGIIDIKNEKIIILDYDEFNRLLEI